MSEQPKENPVVTKEESKPEEIKQEATVQETPPKEEAPA